MAEKFLLDIVTPSGVVLLKEVEEVTAPGENGEFGVLKGHADFLTTLIPGVVKYKSDGASVRFAIGNGFAEVTAERTNILVDTAFPAQSINATEVKDEIKGLEEALKGIKEDDPEYLKLSDKKELLLAKLKAVEGR
ncbi:MAG TPA: ATP synthase F1 subunit epsilon [Thermodesulfobacteriota bacterium]|nr:ATP synthase F1 subunit epsilon [Thermodesulfobacteriota bacterium]